MQSGRSYIKDSGDLNKINLGSLPENVILETTDLVNLYPSIPHEAGLQALEEALENRNHRQISTDKLVKVVQFILRITTSNLTMFSSRYLVQQLGQNLHRHALAFSWIKLKLVF